MKTYRVFWEIDVDADSPREAAEKAREIQLDALSCATVFGVQQVKEDDFFDRETVDLMSAEEE